MLSSSFFIIEAIIGFGVLIFVHELGHFIAAKLIGVRVEAFSLGFGPALKKKWGETEYRLGIFPLGGYVKMAGEEPEPGQKPAPGDFFAQPVGRRALVFGAGVAMNLIFGLIAFLLAYGVGVPVVPAVVGGVEPGSTAWQAGLKTGDHIVGIDDISPPIDFEDLRTAVMLSSSDHGVKLQVSRAGKEFGAVIYPKYNKELGMPTVGIIQPTSMTLAEPPKQEPGEDASQPNFARVFNAGMKPGDVITAVQTPGKSLPTPVSSPEEVQAAVDECAGAPLKIFFKRGNEEKAVSVTPELAPKADRRGLRYIIGVRFGGSNQVSAVRSGAWPERAKFLAGDRITQVNQRAARSRSEIAAELDPLVKSHLPASVTILRGKEKLTLDVPSVDEETDSVLAFEIDASVDRVMPGSPAQTLGLQPGDRILSANGAPINDAAELPKILSDVDGKSVRLVWLRDGKELSGVAFPQRPWVIGIPLESIQEIVKADFTQSFKLSTRKAFQWVFRVYAGIKSLITGRVSSRHLSGPLSIGYLAYVAAKQSFGTFLYILAVLNINLGVMNILPVPVLDGGHLMFAAIEKVRGRAVNQKIRNVAGYVGLALLIALLMLAFWNDIRLFLGLWIGEKDG